MKAHSRFFAVLLVSLVTGWLWAGDAVASQESSVWKLRPWPGSSLVQGLPAQDAARILGDLPRFVQLTSLVLAGNSDLVALVDKAVALPENYVPDDLVVLADAIPGLSVKKASPPLQLRRLALPALHAMVQAARESGIELPISSAYRSYQYQVGLFERYVRESGLAQAERFSARAGHSQHQLGLAIDFGSITVEFADGVVI